MQRANRLAYSIDSLEEPLLELIVWRASEEIDSGPRRLLRVDEISDDLVVDRGAPLWSGFRSHPVVPLCGESVVDCLDAKPLELFKVVAHALEHFRGVPLPAQPSGPARTWIGGWWALRPRLEERCGFRGCSWGLRPSMRWRISDVGKS